MSEVRRDNRNRKLRDGEVQLPDGRYRYRYTGIDGKNYDVYSWKLEASDKTPSGKRDGPSLRQQEKQIALSLFEGVYANGGDLTVVELCEKYLATKTGVKPTTLAGYKTTMNVLRKQPFGNIRIDKIREIDAQLFLIKLQQEEGKSYSSIHCIRGVLRPAFKLAVKNDYIRKSPFEFPLADVLVDDSVRRESITREQQRKFLKFVKEDKHYCKYYDAIYTLFHTGIRISEFCGLTDKDVDMKARTITIDHQLQRMSNGTLYVQNPSSKKASTKTPAGVRVLPMMDDVYECFRHMIANRKTPRVEPVVDGYTGFLSLDKDGTPTVGMHWDHYFQRIVAKYNRIYKEEMPKVTPHVCRHTYCNNMAKSGMNPKVLQYLMGHSEISVTLDTYTHLKADDAREELENMKKTGETRLILSRVKWRFFSNLPSFYPRSLKRYANICGNTPK